MLYCATIKLVKYSILKMPADVLCVSMAVVYISSVTSLLQRITINKKKIIKYADNHEIIFFYNKSKLYKNIIHMHFS